MALGVEAVGFLLVLLSLTVHRGRACVVRFLKMLKREDDKSTFRSKTSDVTHSVTLTTTSFRFIHMVGITV